MAGFSQLTLDFTCNITHSCVRAAARALHSLFIILGLNKACCISHQTYDWPTDGDLTIRLWLGENALKLTVLVVPAQQFARQCGEPDVELILLHSTHAVILKSAFPLTPVKHKHNHNHSWWREVVIPPRVSTCCRWPSDLGLVLIYCHYLQACKGGLNCALLSLDFKLHSDGDEFVRRKPESIPCHCKQLAFAFIIYTGQEHTKSSFPATSLVFGNSMMQA